MLILTVLALSSFIRGHESYEPEVVPLRPSELIPGLEKYSITHHLDFPLPITSDLFFEQFIDKSIQSFLQENIFSTDQGVPNWLLLFTVDNPERYNCHKCRKLMVSFKGLAEQLQLEKPEANFKVGTVMCNTLEAAAICDYFNLQGVPHIMVLRPDQGGLYKFWKFAQDLQTQDAILDFALKSYPYAFTQRGLPYSGEKEAQPFFDGFTAFAQNFFQDIMEENYVVMRGFGLIDAPVAGYSTLYFMTCAAMMTPALLLIYFYLIYKLYKYFTWDFKKDYACPHDLSNDPDFEPETAFEEEKRPGHKKSENKLADKKNN